MKPLYLSNQVNKYHNVTNYVTLLLSNPDSTHKDESFVDYLFSSFSEFQHNKRFWNLKFLARAELNCQTYRRHNLRTVFFSVEFPLRRTWDYKDCYTFHQMCDISNIFYKQGPKNQKYKRFSHSGKSATIRISNHGSGVCIEHYT